MCLFGYHLLLKIENWKYYNKIIFNNINSVVKLNLNLKFTEFRTYKPHK